MLTRSRLVFAALVGALFASAAASANIIVIPVEEDTAPYSFLPSLPRYNNSTLYAFQAFDENSTEHDFETYLWFEVPASVIPAGHVLAQATLVVTYAFDFTGFGETSTAPGELACHVVSTDWSQTTLTWVNRPAIAPPFRKLTGITAYGAQLIDATMVVHRWIYGSTPNHGLALTNSTERVLGMHSREAAVDPSLKPQLILRTEVPEPAATLGLPIGGALLAWLARGRASRPSSPSKRRTSSFVGTLDARA
jgi:hypothetical protein